MKTYMSYDLFRSRRKFNPLTLFYSNSNITYSEFEQFFNNKNVASPGVDYYNRVKAKFEEDKRLEEQANKKDVVIDVEVVEEPKAEVAEEVIEVKKVTSKRGRKPKKKNEDD